MTTFFKWQLPSRTEARQKQRAEKAENWARVCKAVNERDGFCCRACGRRTNPHASSLLEKGHHHHIEFRSKGGHDQTDNVVLLCAVDHDKFHRHELRIEFGSPHGADGPLIFHRIDRAENRWYIARQETAVHQVEKD
jgi:5-methylcytosine-specific restriction endonuclease McrA